MSAREPNNPLRKKKRQIHPGIKLLNLFIILTLFPWPIFAFASLFLFDAPDAAENTAFMTAALLTWTYPIIAIFCLIASRRAKVAKTGLLLAAAPLLEVLFLFAMFALFFGI